MGRIIKPQVKCPTLAPPGRGGSWGERFGAIVQPLWENVLRRPEEPKPATESIASPNEPALSARLVQALILVWKDSDLHSDREGNSLNLSKPEECH